LCCKGSTPRRRIEHKPHLSKEGVINAFKTTTIVHREKEMRIDVMRIGAVGATLIGCFVTEPAAAQKKTIGMVFKVLNNAFTPPLQKGCAEAAKDLGVDCIFIGPTEYNEAQEVQMVQDMLQRGVDGLAVSAANPKAMARMLKQAKEKAVPVVMFDSDVLPEDAGLRLTFIGTDNYLFGAELAKKVLETKKSGGSVCIQSGAPASLNLNDRIQGIRDTLAGASKDKPAQRLAGQNGWTEPAGCPVYNNDDIRLAAQQVSDVFTADPKLDAFIAVGGWAQYAPQAYKQAVELQRSRVDAKELVISFGDNFEPQMPLLKAGLSHYNIGQRPYEMAYTAVKSLVDVFAGKTIPASIVTGLEVCTPATADTCGKSGK
jgi:ribose transport system substrate-binding protein